MFRAFLLKADIYFSHFCIAKFHNYTSHKFYALKSIAIHRKVSAVQLSVLEGTFSVQKRPAGEISESKGDIGDTRSQMETER